MLIPLIKRRKSEIKKLSDLSKLIHHPSDERYPLEILAYQVYQDCLTFPEGFCLKAFSRRRCKLLKGAGSQPLKAIGMLRSYAPILNLRLPEEVWVPRYLTRRLWIKWTGQGNQDVVMARICYARGFASDTHWGDDKIVLISNYTQATRFDRKKCVVTRSTSAAGGTMNIQ